MEQFFEGEVRAKRCQETTYDRLLKLAKKLNFENVATAVGNKEYEEKAKLIKTKNNGK